MLCTIYLPYSVRVYFAFNNQRVPLSERLRPSTEKINHTSMFSGSSKIITNISCSIISVRIAMQYKTYKVFS